MSDYSIKEGANNPSLVVDLFDRYGTPEQAPLQGLDAVERITFVFRNAAKGATDPADVIRDGQNYVDVEDPGTYQPSVVFYWLIDETETIGSGEINFEVEVEWTSGQVEKFPNKGYFTFTIEEDLRGD